MSLLFSYDVTGKNFSAVKRNGKRVSVSSDPFTFKGDTQPLSDRETIALTSGRLSSGMIVVLSEIPLNVSVEGSSVSSRGTYVLYEGKWYEVVSETSSNTKVAALARLNHYEYNAEYRELDVVE